jgi:hypothetical protein
MNTEAMTTARNLLEIWSHLPISDCLEQVELHMESDGFTGYEIRTALDTLEDERFDAESRAIQAGVTYPGKTCAPSCGYCGHCT